MIKNYTTKISVDKTIMEIEKIYLASWNDEGVFLENYLNN